MTKQIFRFHYLFLGAKPLGAVFLAILSPIVIMGIIYGKLHWGELNGTAWKAAIPIWLSVLFLIIGDRFSLIDLKWSKRLSHWGRDYSLGVFILHYFVLIWVSLLIPKVWIWLGYQNPSTFVFIAINIVGFGVAFISTVLLSKSRLTRRLVDVGPFTTDTEIDKVALVFEQIKREANTNNTNAKDKIESIGKFMKDNNM